MEESEAQKEIADNICARGSAENTTNEATGDVFSHVSNCESARKPPEETEARYSRLKLFEKVMQKSLEKFVDHARYTVLLLFY